MERVEKSQRFIKITYRRRDVEGICISSRPLPAEIISVDDLYREIIRVAVQGYFEGKIVREVQISPSKPCLEK